MKNALEDVLDRAWGERDDDLPFKTKREALILASIIEKETAVASERQLISGVFVNRLRRGMRLQTDPTVIYGMNPQEGRLERPISLKDLHTPTPYNTYYIYGLPPTPIALAGKESIFAALQPEKTEYIFFVANGSGGHFFSKTYGEHQNYVKILRNFEKLKKNNEK